MKKFKAMLYHRKKRDGLIFTDQELYETAIKEGWSEVPIGHPNEKKIEEAPKEKKVAKKRKKSKKKS